MTADPVESASLTLGPILFNWPPAQRRDFYFRIADEAPVDVVYIGEVVCSKRSPFFESELPEIVERLERGGKRPVLSTLALVMSVRELDAIRDVVQGTDLMIEANDLASINLLADIPHIVGPFVNVYNEGTAEFLLQRGAQRIVLPNELTARSILAMATASAAARLEVQVFGRLPLAISARCYHARSHRLSKDGCQYVCANDPDGLRLDTLDGEPFLVVNGTQTLSYTVSNLIHELGSLEEAGLRFFRLWPHSADMVSVARVFREVLDGQIEPAAGEASLVDLVDIAPFSNGFYHAKEGVAWVAQTAPMR